MKVGRRDFVSGGIASAVCLSASPSRAAAVTAGVAANVDAYLAPLVERADYSGFVLLERGGQTLVSEGFGWVDDSARMPHTADTHYASASTGKLFTRSAILALEKAGALNRADKLGRFFPSVPQWAPISVADLVDHQSGIARDLPPGTDLQRGRTLDQLTAIIAAMPLEAKPGEVSAYSNNGYRLLARIIEIAGKGDFDPLIRELVLDPRDMRDTVPNIAPLTVKVAPGFRPGPGWRSKERAVGFDMSNFRGAGSFLITPADMLRFAKTLPLEQADLDAAPRTTPDGKPKPRSVGHDGFGDGYANLVYAYPDEKAYLISLSNMQSGAFMPMHADMRNLLFGATVETPAVPAASGPAAADNWQHYVGDYDLRPGNPVRIRRSGDLLTVDGGDGAHPLIPLGGGRFFMRLRYATIKFEGDPAKPATLLRWAEGGGEFPLKRLA